MSFNQEWPRLGLDSYKTTASGMESGVNPRFINRDWREESGGGGGGGEGGGRDTKACYIEYPPFAIPLFVIQFITTQAKVCYPDENSTIPQCSILYDL